MSPYEVNLLIHIDSCRDPIPFKRTNLLQDVLCSFILKGLINPVAAEHSGSEDQVCNWRTTKLGRAVCNKFYAVDESDIKFCGECGQVLPIE